jgi:penicillin-binding protein 1C
VEGDLRRRWRKGHCLSCVLLSVLSGVLSLCVLTWLNLRPLPPTLTPTHAEAHKADVRDRYGAPLSITLQNAWNLHHIVPLHHVPTLLQHAFLLAEDQRFYRHGGVDWRARAHALWQNLRARQVVRGASTISEQVVRMLHPRPRTLWARWLETFESAQLERRFHKTDILAFYLNQVPYARQRRGVLQAARTYFDRDLETLSPKEMLALAVLVRAPGRLDPVRDAKPIEPAIRRLGRRMRDANLLTPTEYRDLHDEPLQLQSPTLPVQASHFVRYVTASRSSDLRRDIVYTTLDAALQTRAQALLDRRLKDLHAHDVTHAGLLIVDHHRDEVLAWVNAGGSAIDAVITPRQPGSTLKPFLYALAVQKGWTAATLIDDTPLSQAVGVGLHPYHNYSRTYYGALRLREALGNSLNIPAIRTMAFVGVQPFLDHLHQLGFQSLTQHPEHYGDGLALGNGEVTLYELVQAYATLARHGVFRPLRHTLVTEIPVAPARRIYSPEVSTLIAHVLADPQARQREFGSGALLRFPVETAVKTGTSTDYRDAWAIGFSHHYTVGVWMGNLTQRPTRGITGSTGPALVLRAMFAELNRRTPSRPLLLSPNLQSATICQVSGQLATPRCPSMIEWFLPHTAPTQTCPLHQPASAARVQPPKHDASAVQLLQPTPGLQLATDPRLPDASEAFPFRLPEKIEPVQTHWFVDGRQVGATQGAERQFLWPLTRGRHTAQARIWVADHAQPLTTAAVEFVVK